MKNKHYREFGNGGNVRRLSFSPLIIELLSERPHTSQEIHESLSLKRTIRYNEVLRVLSSLERDCLIRRTGSHYHISK